MEQRPQDTTATARAQPTLHEQVALVHRLRLARAAAKDELDRLRREWEEANAVWIEQVRLCAADAVSAEMALREAAIYEYRATGTKAPCPGVGIRIVPRLIYAEEEATEWARAHNLFLKLDVKGFEAFAKKSPAQVPWVGVFNDTQVTIATDLGKALAREGD